MGDRLFAGAETPAWSPKLRGAREAVIEYYDACHIDYRLVWRSSRNLSIHFGYFDQQHRSHRAGLSNMNRIMAEKVAVAPGDRVLDAGCGVGGSSIWMAENRDATVCGVNIQPMHLEIARRQVASRGLADRVSFVERNYCDTGLPAGSFDVVWALESLCHSDTKQAFLVEAARLLRDGGRLVVGDFFLFRPSLRPPEEVSMRRWLDGWALPDLAEVGAFGRDVEAAGLKDVTFDDITPNVMRSSRRLFLASLIAIPISSSLKWSGFRSNRQHANVIASNYQYRTIRRGLWGYGIFTATKRTGG